MDLAAAGYKIPIAMSMLSRTIPVLRLSSGALSRRCPRLSSDRSSKLRSEPMCEPQGETTTAERPPVLEQSAMIDALKRKLIETNEALLESRSRLSSTEGRLEMEKREHELTTSKLSLLLRKRTHQSTTPHDENVTTDVGQLHQQIAVLQQQLRCAQENETHLRAELATSASQYEKLRLLTLESFRAQRIAADPSASPTGGLLEAATIASAIASASAPASSAPTSGSNPAAGNTQTSSAPPVLLDAVRMALQPPKQAPTPLCAELWRRPTEHAMPRVGLTRSKSDMSAVTGDGSHSLLNGLNGQVGASASATSGMRRGSGLRTGAPLVGAPMQRSVTEMTPHMRGGTAAGAVVAQATTAAAGAAAGGGGHTDGQSRIVAPHAMPNATSAPSSCAAQPAEVVSTKPSDGAQGAGATARGSPACDPAVAGLPVATATIECSQSVGSASPKLSSNPSPVDVINKVPFGYAKGAICVELPKRQRTTVSSMMPSPRVSQSQR